MGAVRRPTQCESILGAAKNLGIRLYENFVRSAIPDNKREVLDAFSEDQVEVDAKLMNEWLLRQPKAVRKLANSDTPLHLRGYNQFSFMIKNSVKPPLEQNCVHKYASVQTIAYSSKGVNSIFSPIYRVLFKRLLSVLDDRIMILTGLSNSEFESKMNDRLNALVWNLGVQIENDMSKYNKSQLQAVLEFECMLLRALGLPECMLDIWYAFHRFSMMKDRTNGIRFNVEYQRRSSDP